MPTNALTDSVLFAKILDLNILDAADPLVDLGLNDTAAFLSEWRVAGALLELATREMKRSSMRGAEVKFDYMMFRLRRKMTPRAIIESSVAYLTAVNRSITT